MNTLTYKQAKIVDVRSIKGWEIFFLNIIPYLEVIISLLETICNKLYHFSPHTKRSMI